MTFVKDYGLKEDFRRLHSNTVRLKASPQWWRINMAQVNGDLNPFLHLDPD